MTRKLFRSGNSTVISLPAEAMEALGLSEGDDVDLLVDAERHQIVITPAQRPSPGVQLHFLESVDQFRNYE